MLGTEKRIPQKAYKRQVFLFSLLTLLFLSPFLINFILLKCAHELSSYDDIAKIQQKENALHGSALTKNYISYKLALVRQTKPEIIVLGSSRTLQFREEYFTRSFINAGLSMRNLEEGGLFLEKLFKEHRPNLILLGLDPWWFNQGWDADENYSEQTSAGTEISAKGLLKPFHLLQEQKLSYGDYFNIIVKQQLNNPITNYPINLGLRAIILSDGVRRDGSRLASLVLFDYKDDVYPFEDVQFKFTLNNIKKGIRRFEYGQTIPAERIQQLRHIIQLCKSNNVDLILFLPPYAPSVYKQMGKMPKQYAFVPKMRTLIHDTPVESYDFYNPDSIKTSDCEYIDGYHGGDTNAMRILLEIVRQNPDSQIRPYLNLPLLQNASKKFSGVALAIFEPKMYNLHETDFLQMGCKKNTRTAN